MTKSDLSQVRWEAIHSNKTVKLPDYVDVSRETLQEVRFVFPRKLAKDDILLAIYRPKGLKGKWEISWRMRTQIIEGKVHQRFWLIWDRSSNKVFKVNENFVIEKGKSFKSVNANGLNISGIDET